MEPVLAIVLYHRLSRTIGKMERMLVRFRAGRLWRVAQRVSRRDVCGRKAGREPALPRRFGWLVQMGKHHAVFHALQLQTVLSTPEMVELLASSDQARRILRPLCRALAVELPGVSISPEAQRAERPPRKRKPRPKPEPFGHPLPRGVFTWARREKALEKMWAAMV